MFEKQHTIKEEVTVSGVGLHTGVEVRMTFKPAPENHGFVFKRTDLPDQPLVRADVDNVIDTSRGTTIEENGARVHTVEHVLAALSGKQVDNLLIELTGPEPPLMDGSSIDFVDAINKVGLQEQDADREFFVVEEAINYNENDHHVDLTALPLDTFRATVMVDYNSPILGSQHASLLDINDFEKEYAACRTFCFLHEIEGLFKAGLIKGGDPANAIVVVDRNVEQEEIQHLAKLFNRPDIKVAEEGILNNLELRHKNEPARHKLLDLMGDLALVGAPIKAQILAARPGHKVNIELAKKIKAAIRQKKLLRKYQKSPGKDFVFDINAISKILPHRYPFLLVDRITKFSENTIEGYKNVTMDEPFFQGHFAGNPVMPGVLQLEAMAQAGGILLLNTVDNPKEIWVYFLAIDNARFKKTVIPGDCLEFKLELINLKRNICKMHGKGFVDGKLVCEADLTAALVKRETEAN